MKKIFGIVVFIALLQLYAGLAFANNTAKCNKALHQETIQEVQKNADKYQLVIVWNIDNAKAAKTFVEAGNSYAGSYDQVVMLKNIMSNASILIILMDKGCTVASAINSTDAVFAMAKSVNINLNDYKYKK